MSNVADVPEPSSAEPPRAAASKRGPSPGDAVRRLASMLGVTEGQTYTLIIGLVIAMVTAVMGIPPTLRDRATSPAAVAAPPASAPVTSSTTPPALTGTRSPDHVPAPPSTPAPALAPGDTSGVSDTTSPTTDPATSPTTEAATGPPFADGGSFGTVERLSTVPPPGAPDGIAVGPEGEFYVATDNADGRGESGPSKVLRYSAAAVLEDEYEIEGQPADREHGLKGLVLDGDGLLYALDGSMGRIIRLDPDEGTQEVFAKLPDLDPCTPVDQNGCEPGLRNNPPVPRAAVFGESGALFVTDAGQGVVWKVSPLGETEVWVADSRFAPASGPGPGGLQFDTAGKLVLVVTSSLVGLTGGVYVVDVNDNGSSGEVEELYQSQPGEAPRGLALGASGKVYVTLAGANELLVLERNGNEADRISGPEEGGFDAPTALAFRGRSLLVSNQSTDRNDPDSWAVLRVSVQEEGTPLYRPRRESS